MKRNQVVIITKCLYAGRTHTLRFKGFYHGQPIIKVRAKVEAGVRLKRSQDYCVHLVIDRIHSKVIYGRALQIREF